MTDQLVIITSVTWTIGVLALILIAWRLDDIERQVKELREEMNR